MVAYVVTKKDDKAMLEKLQVIGKKVYNDIIEALNGKVDKEEFEELQKEVANLKDYQDEDHDRLKTLEKGNEAICKCILAITDHDSIRNHSYLDDEDFLTITSMEVSIKQRLVSANVDRHMKVCHLNLSLFFSS